MQCSKVNFYADGNKLTTNSPCYKNTTLTVNRIFNFWFVICTLFNRIQSMVRLLIFENWQLYDFQEIFIEGYDIHVVMTIYFNIPPLVGPTLLQWKSSLMTMVTSLVGDNLVVFYNLGESYIWSDKRSSLQWKGPYKRRGGGYSIDNL